MNEALYVVAVLMALLGGAYLAKPRLRAGARRRHRERWHEEQRRRHEMTRAELAAIHEKGPPEPPWRRFPAGESIVWSGWRQGTSEAYLFYTFLPWWHSASSEERRAYVERFVPPHEWVEWLESESRTERHQHA